MVDREGLHSLRLGVGHHERGTRQAAIISKEHKFGSVAAEELLVDRGVASRRTSVLGGISATLIVRTLNVRHDLFNTVG